MIEMKKQLDAHFCLPGGFPPLQLRNPSDRLRFQPPTPRQEPLSFPVEYQYIGWGLKHLKDGVCLFFFIYGGYSAQS